MFMFSIFARWWLPRKLQRSHVIIDNVSAKTGSGAGFLVMGDADISVRNSEGSSQSKGVQLCDQVACKSPCWKCWNLK